MRRDEAWLQQMLDKIWDNYFLEVPQDNDVRIVFGRRAKRRLGSIGLDQDGRTSVITMNAIFKNPNIPEYVVEATLVHELIHYAHGFNSPLQRARQHPHAGGVMRQEYAEKGLLELYQQQKRWLKANWADVVAQEFPLGSSSSRASERSRMKIPKPFWFIGE
jgi:hypothetical protein